MKGFPTLGKTGLNIYNTEMTTVQYFSRMLSRISSFSKGFFC